MTQGTEQERYGASIHRLRPRGPSRDDQGICFSFRINNFSHIHAAYGGDVADGALTHAADLLGKIVGDAGRVSRHAGGWIDAFLWNQETLGSPFEWGPRRFSASFAATLAAKPFVAAGLPIHLAATGKWLGVGDQFSMVQSEVTAPPITIASAQPDDSKWGERYRSDMADVADMFAQIAGDQFGYAWQPIRNGSDDYQVLYVEALLRNINAGSIDTAPASAIAAMERTGFISFLDRRVVSDILGQLETDPSAILGVNISAQSAWLDDWWQDIAARLAVRRDIAHRLIIEITETAPLPSISLAVALSDRLRALGCRIAIDDFGVGYTSIRHLIALSPSIVKLDGFFMRRAEGSERHLKTLKHLAGLASTLAPIVVAEGIETQLQSHLATEAGIDWQQGIFHGRGSLVRSRRGGVHNGDRSRHRFAPSFRDSQNTQQQT